MVKRYIIIFFLMFTAGVFEGSADVIQFHYNGSVFQDLGEWWKHDWTRKYEKAPDGSIILDEAGNLVRKKIWIFPIPVVILDGWHFMKLLVILSYIVLVSFGVLFPIRTTDLKACYGFLLLAAILLTYRTAGFYLAWKFF